MADWTFTVLPAALPLACASCGVEISWRYATGEFSCPACGCGLRLRTRYFRALYLASCGLAVSIMYVIGLRDDALFAAAALALLPIYVVVTVLDMRLFPPEVEISGDFRGILHPPEPEDPSRPPDPIVLRAPTDIAPVEEATAGDGSRLFEPPDPIVLRAPTDMAPVEEATAGDGSRLFEPLPAQPRTFEGVAIYTAGIALVAFTAYVAIQPFIYQLVPEFRATRRGPPGFPATVHIGADALRVSNGSAEAWNCGVSLGVRRAYRGSLHLDAGATEDLRYEKFLSEGAAPADPRARLAAARKEITMDCIAPSGRTHFWVFR